MEDLDTRQACLDTDLIVDYLRKRRPGSTFYKKLQQTKELKITEITVFELFLGAFMSPKAAKRTEEVESILHHKEILTLGKEGGKLVGQIGAKLKARGEPIEIRDLLIAAICLHYKIPLATRNIKHFQRIPNLSLLSSEIQL